MRGQNTAKALVKRIDEINKGNPVTVGIFFYWKEWHTYSGTAGTKEVIKEQRVGGIAESIFCDFDYLPKLARTKYLK